MFLFPIGLSQVDLYFPPCRTDKHTHKEMLLQTIHRTRTATPNGKLLYAAATVDLHRYTTVRMFFKGSLSEKH